MQPTMEALVQKIRRYDLEPYRYFHRVLEGGLDWLELMTRVNGKASLRLVLYKNPNNLEEWIAEEYVDDIYFGVEDKGEMLMEKTGPLELFLSTFERQFGGNLKEAEKILKGVLEAIQDFVCQKQVLGKHGYLKD